MRRRRRIRPRSYMERLLARLVARGWLVERIPFSHGNPKNDLGAA